MDNIDQALANPDGWIVWYEEPEDETATSSIRCTYSVTQVINEMRKTDKRHNPNDNTSDRDALLDFIAIRWATLTKL